MIKSRENANKPVFPAYFRHISGIFGRKNIFFSKIGLRHILNIIILRQCAKFHEKYQVQLEKFKKYRFVDENWQFRRFLASSGIKNQFF